MCPPEKVCFTCYLRAAMRPFCHISAFPKSLGSVPPAIRHTGPLTKHPENVPIFVSRRLQPEYNRTTRYLQILKKCSLHKCRFMSNLRKSKKLCNVFNERFPRMVGLTVSAIIGPLFNFDDCFGPAEQVPLL